MNIRILKILLFSTLALVTITALEAQVPEQEKDALIKLYDVTNGDSWIEKEHWKNGDPCENEWKGVFCNKDDTHIVVLSLWNNNLKGDIPNEISDLEQLIYINFSENPINSIPEEIGNLSNLEKLKLRKTDIKELPNEIGNLSNLVSLKLSSSKNIEEIPSTIGNLDNLERLDIGHTSLKSLPKEIGNLSNLKILSLHDTKIKELPSEIGNLKNLKALSIGRSLLESLPKEIGQLSNLIGLYIDRTPIKSLPKELGDLKNLKYLNCYETPKLVGEIPAGIWDLDKLELLWIVFNNLEGVLPKEIGNLTNIKDLWIAGTFIKGEIPKEIGKLENLHDLSLHGNFLTGKIPKEMGKLHLAYLYLSFNLLEGEIPKEMQDLDNLREIDLYKNSLFTYDEDLDEFLDGKGKHVPDWSDSQTIHVENLEISKVDGDSVKLQWEPIEYKRDYFSYHGAYDIFVKENDKEYEKYVTTNNKEDNNITLIDLKSETDYCFKLQTFTNRNKGRKYHWKSYFSSEVCTTTPKGDPRVTIDDIKITHDAIPIFGGIAQYTQGDLTLSVKDKDYTISPDEDGDWEFTLPDEDELDDGNYTSYIKGEDTQGNEVKDEDDFIVDTAAKVSIEDINVTEDDTPDFHGTSALIDGNLTFNLNNNDYSVEPDEDGDWEFTLPDEDALDDNDYVAIIKGSNDRSEAEASDEFKVDADKPEVTIDDIEKTDDDTPTFSGSSIYTDGDLTFSVNDKEYAVTPEDNGDWEFTLPDDEYLEDGNYTSSIYGKDANENNAKAQDDFSVEAKPEVTINDIDTTDDHTPTFSGTSKRIEGDLTFSVDDKDYSVTPEEDGDWEFTLHDEDALIDGDYTSSIEGSNAHGRKVDREDDFSVETSIFSVENNNHIITQDEMETDEDTKYQIKEDQQKIKKLEEVEDEKDILIENLDKNTNQTFQTQDTLNEKQLNDF